MSLKTHFQFIHTSYLPLPTTTQRDVPESASLSRENDEEIRLRGLRTALALLHQPETMITLNPLVQHYNRVQHDEPESQKRLVNLAKLAPDFDVKLAAPHSCSRFEDSRTGEFVHYEIVDKFELLGGLTHKLMTYRACFRPLYDSTSSASSRTSIGLETISDPGSGVSLLGTWVLGEDKQKPGFLVLSETVQVQCNVLLGWYVRSQLESAHAALHQEFGQMFREKMMQDDPAKGMGKAGKTWEETRREESQKIVSNVSPSSPSGGFAK